MISQVLVYECDYCGHTANIKNQCHLETLSQFLYTIPEGWSFIGRGKIACPNHVVVVKTIQDKDES